MDPFFQGDYGIRDALAIVSRLPLPLPLTLTHGSFLPG